ncbi:MAG: beta-galactosidase [Acidobacteria bacterium]|nr:beta-galactosidase [Acidobacteriota bacterium]
MRSPAPIIAAAAVAAAVVVSGSAAQAQARPMGHVFDWSHELNLEEHPRWKLTGPLPIPKAQWLRMVDSILTTAGSNNLWFSGFGALPYDIPVSPREPSGWRNKSVLMRQYRKTGLSWDVNAEARVAKETLCIFPRNPKTCRPTGMVFQPDTDAPTRRMSLLDPAFQRKALSEIRRIVPTVGREPYVFSYTGSDEPIVVLPTGKAARSALWRRQSAQIRREYGWAPPKHGARRTTAPTAGLSWLAYSRWTSRNFFAMKAQQAALIRRLDPDARISPNNYFFIEGFMPWDYTQLGGFADIAEADPFVSYAEKSSPGRGRYNPGFGAKFMSDLTGRDARIIIQAFPYAGYTPTTGDIDTWTSQALRAGATHISFFAMDNPRFTDRKFYDGMLSLASRLKGLDLPEKPVDTSTVVVYSLMSEGQGQPDRRGDARYRTSGDALYTTYSLLGELNGAPFVFDTDERLAAERERLARAKVVWLPRGDTLSRPFAEALRAWVSAGGFLVVTDPTAFARTPDNQDLSDIGSALMGGRLGGEAGSVLLMQKGALGTAIPPDLFTIPADDRRSWAFTDVPAGATVVATHLDRRPAAVLRTVGQGRVLSFAADPMTPGSLVEPMDLVGLVGMIQRMGGGRTGDPAWTWRVPGTADLPPWEGAYRP